MLAGLPVPATTFRSPTRPTTTSVTPTPGMWKSAFR